MRRSNSPATCLTNPGRLVFFDLKGRLRSQARSPVLIRSRSFAHSQFPNFSIGNFDADRQSKNVSKYISDLYTSIHCSQVHNTLSLIHDERQVYFALVDDNKIIRRRYFLNENHETYTYTARSAINPNKVVTFTLYDSHMRVNLTGFLEQASKVAGADEKPAEIRQQFSTQVKPAAVKMVENLSGPVHIHDVDTRLSGEQLKVTLWQRAGGLRLAPVQFSMRKVDNHEAAKAFVDEVDQRKTESSPRSRFWGPLDYWLGWAGALLLVGFFFRWRRKQDQD